MSPNSPRIRIYCTPYCAFCRMAEQLLGEKGVVEMERIRVDLDPALRAEMTERTGRRTVPQIFIGGAHVGGYDELAALERAGILDNLLRAETGAVETAQERS